MLALIILTFMTMLSRQSKLAILLIAVAVIYEIYCPKDPRRALVAELAARWEGNIMRAQHTPLRIAVGVNTNLDLIVSATDLLRALGLAPGRAEDHTVLVSLGDLQEVVGYSMRHCAGTERTFSDREVFQLTVKAATSVPHSYHIGGNAALMAEKIQSAAPETQVMLAGPIGSKLRELLHSKMETPLHTADSLDEVHMILEYPIGERWGEVCSSCANRVIYSHDVSNSRMVALEGFHRNLVSFKPDLVIISGVHLMDGQPQSFWEERLRDIEGMLENIPASTPVHWELATVGNLKFLQYMAGGVFPRTTSVGLNEQELVSVARAAGAGFNFSEIPPKPGIEHVSDLLHWLMQTYSQANTDSRLSRVHFHSLSFHIIAVVKGGPWDNSRSAVLAGTRVAGLQACDLEKFQPAKFELQIPLNFSLSYSDPRLSQTRVTFSSSEPVVSWERGGVEYHLSPVLVCKNPLKTVGLGDAISSLGLLYSDFHPRK